MTLMLDHMTLTALIAALAIGLIVWARLDYQAWVGLGLGGLPHNPLGWAAMTALRLLKRDARKAQALKAVLHKDDDRAYLGNMIRRAGQRPLVPPHPIPQRQLTDLPDAHIRQDLELLFERHVKADSSLLTWARSAFEKQHRAIALKHPECGWACAQRWHGEVAHIHPSDGSMHMILSPSDAAQVVEKGWGELHTLSGRLGLLPPSYTFVYAPRTAEDVEAIESILRAAVAHMSRSSPAT